MSLKRILAGILSASLVLTVALSGCNNGQSGSADPSSSTGTQEISLKSYKPLLITILWALFSPPPTFWSGMKELKPSLSYKAMIKAIQKS